MSAEPLAVLALVVVTVERQTVTVRAERIALPIISTFSEIPDRGQAGECILVAGMMADLDRAQGVKGVVDKEQDFIKAFPCITDHFRDVEGRKATREVLEARDGQ